MFYNAHSYCICPLHTLAVITTPMSSTDMFTLFVSEASLCTEACKTQVEVAASEYSTSVVQKPWIGPGRNSSIMTNHYCAHHNNASVTIIYNHREKNLKDTTRWYESEKIHFAGRAVCLILNNKLLACWWLLIQVCQSIFLSGTKISHCSLAVYSGRCSSFLAGYRTWVRLERQCSLEGRLCLVMPWKIFQ